MGKLSASTSCQATTSESITDRFSDLPDEVAHLILSFLPFKDLTRMSAVSKRCTQLYPSVPVLNFIFCWEKPEIDQDIQMLMSSLDRYLFSRGDHRIQRFCMNWNLYPNKTIEELSNYHFRLNTWIRNAVRCHVEELDLLIYPADGFSLPSCVFLSPYLRSLSVDLARQILEVPSLPFPSNIHDLKLAHVNLDERFFQWISCSCKCIKKLNLHFIRGTQNITIESSSLEHLHVLIFRDLHLNISCEKLETIKINLGPERHRATSSNSLKIFAPNLKKLQWIGSPWSSRNLGKLMSLEKVVLFLKPRPNEIDNVFEALCSIRWARVLIISEDTIKALFKEGSMAAPILDNICNLRIHCTTLEDDLVPAVVSLLRGMPNLNSLSIRTVKGPLNAKPSSGFGTEYWKLQNLAFLHQLKEVTIQYSDDGSNEIEFSTYILENAQNLKKIVIFLGCGDEQSKAAEMVSRIKMISTATIIIRRRE